MNKCEKCGHELQIGDYPFCPHGNNFKQYSGSLSFPYTTSHITGKPIEVRSESHLKELCQTHGVTHRPDAAWVEKRIIGTGRDGKPIYKEGNGVGLPGCWV